MDAVFVYFAHRDDAELLAVSVARLRQVVPGARVVVAVERSAPARVPDGCEVAEVELRRVRPGARVPALAFDLDSMAQMLQVMEAAMVRHGVQHCVKLDADMWVNGLEGLLAPVTVPSGLPEADFLAPEAWRPMIPGPGVFRISIWGCRECLRQVVAGARMERWPRGMGFAENVFFYHLLGCSHCVVRLVTRGSGCLAGFVQSAQGVPEVVRQAGLVHCGEPMADGSRAPRELVLTRMLLLSSV